jgi:hypothetical protein
MPRCEENRLDPPTERRVKRSQLIQETRRLIAEGERLERAPNLRGLRIWIALSDELLSSAWGSMDRYHLAWLMVGRSADIVRGRQMTPTEEQAYVRDVAAQKTAALRMSLKAVAEQHMPFVGETPEDAEGDWSPFRRSRRRGASSLRRLGRSDLRSAGSRRAGA